jgi:hypothetical protein
MTKSVVNPVFLIHVALSHLQAGRRRAVNGGIRDNPYLRQVIISIPTILFILLILSVNPVCSPEFL